MENIIKIGAKINLNLSVSLGDNGYHKLSSLAIPINLLDIITCYQSNCNKVIIKNNYDIFGKNIEEINQINNTAYIALVKMQELLKIKENYEIIIEKNIPIGAGLGGSSADAAGVILLLCRLYSYEIDEDIINLAASIGKDIPFFLYSKPAIMRGYGEKLDFVDINNSIEIGLINCDTGNSTAKVYKEFDRLEIESSEFNNSEKLLNSLNSDNIYKNYMINDLLQPARNINSEMAATIDLLKRNNIDVFMTGSGSSLFIMNPTIDELKLCKKMHQKIHVFNVLKAN